MRRDNKHVSADEKKKGVLIFILLGILAVIILTIIIIMIPKGNKKDTTTSGQATTGTGTSSKQEEIEDISKESNKNSKQSSTEKNSNSTGGNLDLIAKDKNKVSITIKTGTLTVDGAVIVITDSNISPYSWTPIYKLQQKVDGQWQDMELKNPENALFPDIEYDNETGVMEQSLVWSNKYGQVGVGEYRIVKEASRN